MKVQERFLRVKRETGTGAPDPLVFSEEAIGRARRVSSVVRAWARRYPVMLSRRIVPITLNCAAMCEHAPDAVIVRSVKLSMIICAIDDLADGVIDTLSDAQIHETLLIYAGIAANPQRWSRDRSDTTVAPTATQQVAIALDELCCEMTRRNYLLFVQYFAECMREMQTERAWRTAFVERREIPTFDDYMHTAQRTIACGVLWTGLLSMGVLRQDQDEAPAVIFDGACERAITAGSRCVRLANDLRGHVRETSFEGKPNGIAALVCHSGMTEAEAEQDIRGRADRAHQEMTVAIQSLPAALAEWGQCVRRFSESTARWYSIMEFHHTPAKLAELFAVDEEA